MNHLLHVTACDVEDITHQADMDPYASAVGLNNHSTSMTDFSAGWWHNLQPQGIHPLGLYTQDQTVSPHSLRKKPFRVLETHIYGYIRIYKFHSDISLGPMVS